MLQYVYEGFNYLIMYNKFNIYILLLKLTNNKQPYVCTGTPEEE